MDIRDPQTHAIIGAAMAVHAELGRGFLETVYHQALAIEFKERGIPFVREVALPVAYKGQPLEAFFRADFICYGEVVVELKAISTTTNADIAQLINYIKVTGLQRGLLLNFGAKSLQFERKVLDYDE